MRSEANILPQIVPEILGNKLILNGIWHLLPLKFLDMCQKPSRNSQTDLKISSIEDTSRVKNGDSVTNLRLTKFDDFILYFRIFATK